MIKKLKSLCRNAFSQTMQWTLRILVYPAFRPQLVFASPEAKRNFPEGPCVLISNHVTMLDAGPIETLLHKKHFYGLTAADIIRDYKFIGWFLSFLPAIPINRENVSLTWLREGRRLLKAGNSIYLCPEGHCNYDKVISDFKPGFVTLAALANVPVVPLYHNGEFNYFFGKRFKLIVGDPIHLQVPPEGMTDEFMRTESAKATSIVRGLEKQLIGYNHKADALPEKSASAKKE